MKDLQTWTGRPIPKVLIFFRYNLLELIRVSYLREIQCYIIEASKYRCLLGEVAIVRVIERVFDVIANKHLNVSWRLFIAFQFVGRHLFEVDMLAGSLDGVLWFGVEVEPYFFPRTLWCSDIVPKCLTMKEPRSVSGETESYERVLCAEHQLMNGREDETGVRRR